VREMLAQAVTSGTGQAAAIDGYHAAGKTGTARKPQPGGGYRDAQGNYHYVASFAGFIPADDPQVSIIIVIDEPTTSAYASDVAAPAFASIGRQALQIMRIAPPAAAGAVGTLPPLEEPKVRAEPALPPTTTTTTTTAAPATTTVPGAIPPTASPVSPTTQSGQPATTTTAPIPARGG
jgi:cell division protein FtsI (penicillin-binding protein 3)